MATAKHFVNNEQETKRNSINSVVSEDTNWNLYYRPFLASVRRANVASVMCSYNKINGEFACENSLILQRDLRTAMGFQGVVVSDWFATRSTLNSAKAGLDMEMPIPLFYGKAMERLVQHGDLDESVVNRKVEQVLATMDRFKVKHSVPEFHPKRNATSRAHYNLARLAAASSAVLLKNHDAILPIDASQVGRIVVLGDGGRDKVLYTGGGSGHVSPAYIVSPFDAVRHHAAASNPEIPVEYHSTDSALGLKQRFGRDVLVLVFVGTSSTEAKDRATLGFEPKQLALVEHTTRFLSDRVVVCATAPGAVLLPFYDTVQAVVLQFLAGQATGDGLADVLFGVVDPGGARLPVTMPNKDNEVESPPSNSLESTLWPTTRRNCSLATGTTPATPT
ncbi:hypothetical protein BASA82_000175 [Batrachochytrium salamandrivorans]|nr:hypothetical protein BASA82_000175 [Batrachochytrium salamandrivorans]